MVGGNGEEFLSLPPSFSFSLKLLLKHAYMCGVYTLGHLFHAGIAHTFIYATCVYSVSFPQTPPLPELASESVQ